jgi:hypothetical protein
MRCSTRNLSGSALTYYALSAAMTGYLSGTPQIANAFRCDTSPSAIVAMVFTKESDHAL